MKTTIRAITVFAAAAMLAGCSASASKLTRGTYSNSTYSSSYFNLKIAMPEGFSENTSSDLTQYGCQAYTEYSSLSFDEAFKKCESEKDTTYFYDLDLSDDSSSMITVLMEDITSRSGNDLTDIVNAETGAAKKYAGTDAVISDIVPVTFASNDWQSFTCITAENKIAMKEYVLTETVGDTKWAITVSVITSASDSSLLEPITAAIEQN